MFQRKIYGWGVLIIGIICFFNSQCSSTYSRRVPCNQITSWDECEKDSHCSPVRFFVSNDYKGPAWACESKNQK